MWAVAFGAVAAAAVLAEAVTASSSEGGLSEQGGGRVSVPSRVRLRGGGVLTLAFLSNEDVRTLMHEANLKGSEIPVHFSPPPDYVQLPEGYRRLPWRLLDVDVALARVRREGLSTSGWVEVPRVVTHKNLSEGEHVPRFVSEEDIRVLRRGNGCADEDARCGQYELNLSTMQPVLSHVTTREMLRGAPGA